MIYATATDLEKRYGAAPLLELANRDGDGVADADVIDTALNDSSQTVNGYVAASYQVPLDPVPDQVVRWTSDIAWYFLHGDGATEGVAANYKTAIAALRDVQSGRITLQCAGSPVTESVSDDYTVLVSTSPAAPFPRSEEW